MSGVECGQCGDCCRAFKLNLPADFRIGPELESAAFVRDNVYQLTLDEVKARLPHSAVMLTVYDHRDVPFYSCRKFDEVTGLCTAHDDRPPMCRGFPFYDYRDPSLTELYLYPGCTFWLDTIGTKIPDELQQAIDQQQQRSAP